MQRKSILVVIALVAGVAFGVVFGPSLRINAVSAQTQPPTQTPAPSQPQQGTTANSLRDSFLNKLAAALNIQRSALNSAMSSAGSSTLDEAVQQGTLTQAQADALKSRLQSGDFGALLGGRGNFGGKVGGPKADGGVRQAIVAAVTKALNMTTQDLMTQLRNGQTLAQLAQARGTTEQAVTSAALAAAKTQLDQAVSNGSMTQAQADALYARLQQAGTQLLEPHGRGMGGGRQRPGAPTAPQAPTTTTPQT